MLTKLTVRNFQAHKKTEIDFGRITTITGRTDAGKSAIWRAVRWVCTNKPGGDGFRRRVGEGLGGTTVVRVEGDGHTVRRVRGTHNTYSLNGVRYAAFGAGVPDEIANVLNVGEVNFQGQHAPPFWFSLSPGQVSKELNQIVALDLIDRTLSLAAAEVRKTKAEVSLTEQRLAAAEERIEGLKWVEQADAELRDLEQLYTDLQGQRDKRRVLSEKLKKASEYAATLRNAGKAHFYAFQAVSDGERVITSRRKADQLRELLYKITQLREQQCQFAEKRTVAEKALAAVKTCPLCGAAR